MVDQNSQVLEPVGYRALVDQYNLQVLPHYRDSYIHLSGRGYQKLDSVPQVYVYTKSYRVSDSENAMLQLEFAIKYDGINLAILKALFTSLPQKEIENFILEKSVSKYRRKIWFLYEFLMNTRLNIDDLQNVPYVNLLDENQYYAGDILKSRRQAINNNLLGSADFCPFVRKTEKLTAYEAKKLNLSIHRLIKKIDLSVLARAISYLYTKETQSSFQIEHIKPSLKRSERFVKLLEEAPEIGELTKVVLLVLQNSIVEDPYMDEDYRHNQNYVGELTRFYQQKIHYISPKPEDIQALMEGYLGFVNRAMHFQTHPVVLAAAVSFGFVFLHPFEDGNGRIHRFLIHYVLSKLNYTPETMIFPVSTVMLRDIRGYDRLLETFSKPLLSTIDDYSLNDHGELTVHGETRLQYQYIDYTSFAEYLFECIEQTIEKDFKEELVFIQKYDKTKQEIQQRIDMPDIKIDRIIRCISQNEGRLGKKMRTRYFQELSDERVVEIEGIVRKYMMQYPLSTDDDML